jgi:hypothetical protein
MRCFLTRIPIRRVPALDHVNGRDGEEPCSGNQVD